MKVLMAKLSEIAYKRDSRMKEELKKLGINSYIKREVKDLKYIIVERNNETYIAIRGSFNKRNWIRNLNFFPKKGTHRGFRNGANLLYEDIKKLDISRPVNVTGHSLGGAIAIELSQKMNCRTVYTFGKPRLYTKKSKLLNSDIIYRRYVNNLDGVTQLPPVFIGYKHKTDAYYIARSGTIYIDPSNETIAKDRIETLAKSKNLKELYKDHEISYYVDLLENKI